MAVFSGRTHERIKPGTDEPVELAPASTPKIKPKTKVASGGSKRQALIGGGGGRDKEKLEKWKKIYENGGAESQVLETYALFIMANGYRLEGENPTDVQKCQDFKNSFDFDDCLYKGVIDALWAGSAFQELVAGRVSSVRLEEIQRNLGNMTPAELTAFVKLAAIKGGDILAIVPREAESFSVGWDDNGTVTEYTQTVSVGGKDQEITLKPEQILHIKFFGSGGSIYGLSMFQRAYDEIMRDTKTAEASAQAIDRHGFKKYHIKVGQPGEIVDNDVIDDVSTEFQDIATDNEFTTSADVEIKNIDEGGLDKVEDYNDISIMRMCAAMGIPEELLGMRRGPLVPDTEVLTHSGWVKIPDVKIGDEIFTLNPDTKEIRYQPIQNTYRYFVDEDLYHFEGKYLDVLCTHDHKVYARPIHKDEFSLMQASEVPGIFSFMVGGGIWKGIEKDFFEIPAMDIFVGDRWNNTAVKTRTQPAVIIPMDTWLEFLGYFISEGSTSTRKYEYCVEIHQNNGEGLDKIIECAKKLPFKVYIDADQIRIYSKQLWSCLSPLGTQPVRYIPEELKKLSTRQLKILYDALMFGDGSDNGYYSSSQKLAEDVQELRIKMGVAANVYTRDRIGNDVVIYGKKCGTAKYIEHRVGLNDDHLYPELRRNSCAGHNQGVFLEHYTGWVHCVEVPDHVILIRYNGKTCFVGNSTDATAVERIRIFLKRIAWMQKRLATIYNINVFDRITGKPGAVRLVFNDVDPSGEATDADWISKLMKASPQNPFSIIPVEWIQQRLNIIPKLAESDGHPVQKGGIT